jgi:hypothetical protein
VRTMRPEPDRIQLLGFEVAYDKSGR